MQVEPFPLPDLLPLCGLAPAALHAVVEQAMGPLVDAAFSPATTSTNGGAAATSNGHLSNMTETLLHVAGHPSVDHGGSAVRLQMALETVAYCVAMTPLDLGQGRDGLCKHTPTKKCSVCGFV
jgi:hypothetical protein